ncbi:hypothetical protein WA026_012827 [Henosepilachna vigintioctopunctata]|uniref:Nuclear receptor domain-containing protein n=1 Tax=Henosepilachna vigintioctopunctata TaxID=420089 RepID=A0AAW1TRZ7_9CUCU
MLKKTTSQNKYIILLNILFFVFQSFFGRTYNNLNSISECKNNGECVINKKNRTACKACRLRKCILVGMSKSGSRYGRRSNWFKIHCLLQEQQQAGSNMGMAAAAGLFRPHPYLTTLFRPTPTTAAQETRSSESDSGASSVDIEDDAKSSCRDSYIKPSMSPSSDRDYFSGGSSKKHSSPASDSEYFARRKLASLPIPPISPASLPSVSPSSIVPKWFPAIPAFTDPSSLRDLWLRVPPPVATPAPNQDQPIDLSIKPQIPYVPCLKSGSDNNIISEESLRSVPLDLTLDRQTADISNC